MTPVIIEKNDIHCTLTTYIYCSFWMMWAAEQQGRQVYINWPPGGSVKSYEDKERFAAQPNQFEWYFKQPMLQEKPEGAEVLTWENWQDPCPVPFMAQPLQVIKDYYRRHLKFSGEVEQRGRQLIEKYGIDFSNTIGITWRGTDIYLDGRPRTPIEYYYPWIDRVLKPGMRIMCTAEEVGILEPLLARYPQAFKVEEFIQAPYNGKDNPERFSPVSGFERGMQPALMVWLFSKCAHYIKNRSSTGAVASWISKGEIVSIGHPENLGFPANTQTVELNGQLYDFTGNLLEA